MWRPYYDELVGGNPPAEVLLKLRTHCMDETKFRPGTSSALRFANNVRRVRKELVDQQVVDPTLQTNLKKLRGGRVPAVRERIRAFGQLDPAEMRRVQLRIRKTGVTGGGGDYLYTGEAATDQKLGDLRVVRHLDAFKLEAKDAVLVRSAKSQGLEKKSTNVTHLRAKDADALVAACRDVISRAAQLHASATLGAAGTAEGTAANLQEALKRSGLDARLLLCMVALATGRRSAELFSHHTSFDAVPGAAYMACFHGQLKRVLNADSCYYIPLLAPCADVRAALQVLHAVRPPQNTAAEAHRRNATYGKRALHVPWTQPLRGGGRRSSHDVGISHFHALRELYGSITFTLCRHDVDRGGAGRPHSYSLHRWLQMVLGHASLNESAHYSNIVVDGSLKVAPVPFVDHRRAAERRKESSHVAAYAGDHDLRSTFSDSADENPVDF